MKRILGHNEVARNRISMAVVIVTIIIIILVVTLFMTDKSKSEDKWESGNITRESGSANQMADTGKIASETPARFNEQQVMDYWNEVLPKEMSDEVHLIRFTSSKYSSISRWEIDREDQQVTLYVYDICNQTAIDEVQVKKYGNWTIAFVNDTAFQQEIDDMKAQMNQLKQRPELHIDSINLGPNPWVVPTDKSVDILVYDTMHPDLQKLDKTEINGWKIRVYIV